MFAIFFETVSDVFNDSVAIALIGDPEVVLLDEPSAGLGATIFP